MSIVDFGSSIVSTNPSYCVPDSNEVHMLRRDSDASASSLPFNAQSAPPYPLEQAHFVVHNGLVRRHSVRREPDVSRY